MSDIFSGLLTTDSRGFAGFSDTPQWGIFLGGEAVVVAESVAAFSFKQEWPISTYQVEQGSFETYDKVEMPFEPRVRFASGGDAATREALLDSIDAIAGDTNLYDVVTPEKIYLSCNVTGYDYRRTSNNGVGLIVVEVHLLQVRVASSAQYNTATPISSAKSSAAADPANGGTVQAATPSQVVQSDFDALNASGWAGH